MAMSQTRGIRYYLAPSLDRARADVAKLVDAPALGAGGATHPGSSPGVRIENQLQLKVDSFRGKASTLVDSCGVWGHSFQVASLRSWNRRPAVALRSQDVAPINVVLVSNAPELSTQRNPIRGSVRPKPVLLLDVSTLTRDSDVA